MYIITQVLSFLNFLSSMFCCRTHPNHYFDSDQSYHEIENGYSSDVISTYEYVPTFRHCNTHAFSSKQVTYIKDTNFMFLQKHNNKIYTILNTKTNTLHTTFNPYGVVLEIMCFIKKEDAIKYIGNNNKNWIVKSLQYGKLLAMNNLNNNIALKVFEDV